MNGIDIKSMKLPDIIDVKSLQLMADLIYSSAGFPIGIIGVDNTIYVAAGWQDICTKFHRVNPECRELCFKSDAFISEHLNDEARFIEYKCLNGLWDMASPIIIDGVHMATLFLGQFFYENDEKDIDSFKERAKKFGFDEAEYLEALAKVPVFTRQKVQSILDYYKLLLKTLVETGDSKYRRLLSDTKLKKTENTFFSLFNAMNEGAALHKIVYGAGGKAENYIIIDINKQYEKIIGLKKEDVAGKTSTEVYKVPVPPYLEEFTSVARDNKTFQFETYFAPMDKYFLISVFSFEADHFATIFFDITANKLAELEREKFIKELESKNAELERFTYTVSHDLKSPLITIKGFLGMLDSDMARGDEKRIKSDIKRIADAADKMAFLLDDLLELSRIGRIINPPKLFPLGELVSEVAELLSSTIAASRASIKTAGELPSVFGDRKRIFEVIQNLVENAIKFKRDDAAPEIEIGAKSSGDSTIVYVRDNGIGIESKYFENVFGLFNKLNTSSAGTGIGLALVKRIAEVHGGKAWVESDGPGHGSVFYFSLPEIKKEEF